MKSTSSYQTPSRFRCDSCFTRPARAIIRLIGFPGDQLPRACLTCLPALFAKMDLEPALDGIEVLA